MGVGDFVEVYGYLGLIVVFKDGLNKVYLELRCYGVILGIGGIS